MEILEQCTRYVGIGSTIRLRISPDAYSPAVCGLIRPTILIPASLLDKLSPENLRAVFIHELVHIKRGDLWVSLAQTILQVIYFYNPLVWLANAIVRCIREQAVDEMVLVALGTKAGSYSDTLIDIAEMAFSRMTPALSLVGVAESRKLLEGRIRHMITRPIPKSTRMRIKDLLVVVVLGAILLPMAAAEPQKQEDIPKLPKGIAEMFQLSKDDILTKFGQPQNIFYGDNRYTLDDLPERYFMIYGDQQLSFHIGNGQVGGITLLGPDYVFSNGICAGVSEAKVAEAFGTDYEFKETPFKDFLTYEDLGLSFEINKDDRTVMEININEDYGSPARQRAWAEGKTFAQTLAKKIAKLKIDTVDFGGRQNRVWRAAQIHLGR